MRIAFTVCGVFLFFSSANAQLGLSSIPISISNPNYKSATLGNAVVSLDESYGDFHINPAGVGILDIASFSFDWQNPGENYDRLFIDTSYKIKKSGVSFSYLRYRWGNPLNRAGGPKLIGRFNSDEHFWNASYSYTFSENLSTGVGVNFVHVKGGAGSIFIFQPVDDLKFFTFNAGLIYRGKSYTNALGSVTPHTGFSITNLGSAQEYYSQIKKEPLPSRLRAGGGITFVSDHRLKGKEFIQLLMIVNASKMTGRVDSQTNEPEPALTSLFTSWGTFEWFDSQRMQSYSLSEQVWLHTGLEIKFLETFSVRLGREKAAKAEDWLSYKALGFGIDLHYLSLDYSYIKLDYPNYGYYNYYRGVSWQLTGRIPLNGK